MGSPLCTTNETGKHENRRTSLSVIKWEFLTTLTPPISKHPLKFWIWLSININFNLPRSYYSFDTVFSYVTLYVSFTLKHHFLSITLIYTGLQTLQCIVFYFTLYLSPKLQDAFCKYIYKISLKTVFSKSRSSLLVKTFSLGQSFCNKLFYGLFPKKTNLFENYNLSTNNIYDRMKTILSTYFSARTAF